MPTVTSPWTATLRTDLADQLQGGCWSRVERAKDGGWLALEQRDTGPVWYRLDETGHHRVGPLEDRRLRGFAASVGDWWAQGWSVEVLAHRVGSRALVRLRRGDQVCLAKIYRKDRDLERRWRALSSTPNHRTPDILSWDPDRLVLLMEEAPGQSLYDLWENPRGDEGGVIAGVLGWLSTHELEDGHPRYRVEDECRALLERVEEFTAVLQAPLPEVSEVAKRVSDHLERVATDDRVACHRDLHDKQILVAAQGVTVIDHDLLARGPVGLDAGNILAHLRLRSLQGRPVDWKRIGREMRDHLRGDLEPTVWAAWTAATLSRLSLIYARRRRNPGLLEALATEAQLAMHADGEWSEVLR